ncbi:hypothetical protein XBFFL1_1790006 [Xenorhabdus bovienii str. feltiae Florida]|uniref:Uncharacterized protein n=1 Tax=Xenorhabdus bovienii str. feltiae Moldova TaxID=1398200 RepID=A0A077NRE7_XENBV|nr:hypothetical protein XBFFL1_1790006 [Xenorhabdus bovienii str. feltiae Florida]CDH01440.1 hypothetical protein XBFM1_2150018 [Xenorhabdus bovienii str. feltiae Moldova]
MSAGREHHKTYTNLFLMILATLFNHLTVFTVPLLPKPQYLSE